MLKKIIVSVIVILLVFLWYFTYFKFISPAIKNNNIVTTSKDVQKIFENVRVSWDTSKCDNLIAWNLKDRCISLAKNSNNIKSAMTKWDASYCNLIEHLDVKNTCLEDLAARTIKLDAILSWDVSKCNKIDIYKQKSICISKVNDFLQAIKNKDPDKCITLLNKNVEDECRKRILWQDK